MIEAVENQSPDFVIVDEISTKEECQAARTITGVYGCLHMCVCVNTSC